MNSHWPRALISFGSLGGAAMIAAVQIPPETATSNLAAWATMFGFNRIALALPPSIDIWVTAFALAFIVTCLLVGIDLMRVAAKAAKTARKRKARSR
jgi:hypothetical protein